MPKGTDYNYPGEFKRKYTLQERTYESDRVRSKYMDRIPIIVEQAKGGTLPLLDKRKYLVPDDMTMGQFSYVIRKRLKLKPDIAIFIMVGNTMTPTSSFMSELYEKFSDADGFLYCVLNSESVFGTNML